MTIGKSTVSPLMRCPRRPGPGCCRKTKPTGGEVEMSPSLVGLFTGGSATQGPGECQRAGACQETEVSVTGSSHRALEQGLELNQDMRQTEDDISRADPSLLPSTAPGESEGLSSKVILKCACCGYCLFISHLY